MKKIYVILSALTYMFFGGCLEHPKYLESKYFWQRKIDVVENATNVFISVSGLCGHSSLGVDPSEKSVCEDVLIVELPLRLGTSGTIHETIRVPDHINKVKFAGDLIWVRRSNH